jgi:hypothetical protein
VNINNSSNDIMGTLPPHHLPILTNSTEITFSHPFTKKKCRIQRTQVPVLPAFAMTAHRAQGQTLNNVIVDLQSCRGTEAPYVMISHAHSLDGLLILRPFDHRKICCCQSEDARKENQRLELLNLIMLLKLGTESEKQQVSESMKNYNMTKASIVSIIPDNYHSGLTTTNAENTIEKYQSQLENFSYLHNLEQIQGLHSKAPLQVESDDEDHGEDCEDGNISVDVAHHTEDGVLTVVNNVSTSPTDTLDMVTT